MRGLIVAALLRAVVFVALLAPAAVWAAPVPVTVVITSVECVEEGECRNAGIEAAGESWPDFYARVFIGGVPTDTPRAPDDQDKVKNMGWTVSRVVDDAPGTVPITIQVWDHDDTSGDDNGDTSPVADKNNLDIVLNLATGRWSGDTTTACATGDGVDTDDTEYYPLKVCFDVMTIDTDGDGLLDTWESSGFDANGDGDTTDAEDLDLPAWGANPLRQDVFLELDYETGRAPTRDGINAMKRAFASAPRPNPDGTSGITLHVDAGFLVDSSADEAGRTGTCSNGADDDVDGLPDGLDSSCGFLDASREVGAPDCANLTAGGVPIDDDGDGLANGADPQCLVGDDFGGGQAIATPVGACGRDAVFYAAKAVNFDPNRAWVFHYAIQAAAPPNPPAPAPALNCSGGDGEIGGNDFISHNLDPGTLMHELGHNMNLRHGGSVDANCKPNYLSVMNYQQQVGIPRTGGGTILDFSPPRLALDGSSRAVAPLASLVENALNESTPVDPADAANAMRFINGAGVRTTTSVNLQPNWNGDTDPPLETNAIANIDTGLAASATAPAIWRACINTVTNSTLAGDVDWSRVVLNFRQFGDAATAGDDQPHNDIGMPTQPELEQMLVDDRTTDLSTSLAASPDPVAAGTPIAYAATVRNDGPNPALAVRLELTLPPETTHAGMPPAGCAEPSPGTIVCDLGTLLPAESRDVAVSADVPSSLVHDAGAPLTVTADVSVTDRAGVEADPSDNAASAAVTAVAVADLSMAGLAASNPPLQMRTGEQVVVEIGSSIGSAGPSSPMDTELTFTATADAGASVSPTWLKTGQVALLNGESRSVANHPILHCRTPGRHRYDFEHRLNPARAPDTDPNGANNLTRLSLVVECLGTDEVVVNLQPGAWPNQVPLGSRDVSLAVLTTAAGEYGRATGFDATGVLVESVRIGSRRMLDGSEAGTDRWAATSFEDSVERIVPETQQDGDPDLLVSIIDVDTTGVRAGDTEVCVMGRFRDASTGEERDFFGCDDAVVVP